MPRNEKPTEEKPKHYVQKFSNDKMLAEAVLIGDKPFFLVAEKGKILVQDHIPFDDKILKPLEPLSYVNKPYSFESDIELDAYPTKVNPDTLDSLYRSVKSIWKKYVDADDFHLSICAADSIFTYFQDKIGLTHYLFFVGPPGSGKSNNLTVFQFLGYRNMTSSDMSHSNIYQFLGSMDEGVGTLCEDEADNIDEDTDKMRIYKNGYTTGRPVLKTDTTYGRKQYRFNTFCFKAFAAERLPDSVKAKGFNQRIIEIPCVYGFPEHDISEVVNPAGEREHFLLLEELMEARNALLIYRLLHYGEKISNIRTNLLNREKQLFKPVLRIFHNTSVLDKLLPVISKYVSQKRENNANTLYAAIYRIVTGLIKIHGTPKLESTLITNAIFQDLECEQIPGRPKTFISAEFGELSTTRLVNILKDVFGATKSRRHDESRKLIFEIKKLERLGRLYELSLDVQVTEDNGEDRTTRTTRTTSGLIPSVIDYSKDIESKNSMDKKDKNSTIQNEITQEVKADKPNDMPPNPVKSSDMSDMSDP